MASAPYEYTPLLHHEPRPSSPEPGREQRRTGKTVTFRPTPSAAGTSASSMARATAQKPYSAGASSFPSGSGGQPVLSALNNRLRRRHSHGPVPAAAAVPVPKIGPQRTTKTTQKLKLLPNPVTGEEDEWIEEGVPHDVYSQIRRIKEPTARRDAVRLGKADRERLPRVTAYCTANSYKLVEVVEFLKWKGRQCGTNPRLFDECVYSPFNYHHGQKAKSPERQQNAAERQIPEVPSPSEHIPRRFSDSELEVEAHREEERENLVGLQAPEDGIQALPANANVPSSPEMDLARAQDLTPDLDTRIHTPEIFLFDYGTVVIWGMTPDDETRFLNDVSRFARTVLSTEDTQVENFNFYYTRDYQARIYNDFISLRDPRSYMTKLAISHALSQSVKTSLFEDLVDETITTTAPLPAQIARTGGVSLSRRQINMQIGELFILRINIHMQGSVLDSPELMWSEPQLDPIYQAVRTYLEMDQRVGLLTERLDVIADLLAVLKDQLSHRHGEYLEWIVIILIAAEIVVAGINIIVDLYAGV